MIWEKSRNLILVKIKIMKFNTRYRSISDVEVYEQNKDLHIMSNIINIIRPKLPECKIIFTAYNYLPYPFRLLKSLCFVIFSLFVDLFGVVFVCYCFDKIMNSIFSPLGSK